MLNKVFLVVLTALAVSAGRASAENDREAMTKSAFDDFYNLDYDMAIGEFRAIASQAPKDPGAWNHVAQVLFYDSLFRAGLMGSDLIKTNDAMMKSPKLTMSVEREQELQGALAKSVALCQDSLKANATDAAAIYELGNAYALRANFVFLTRHAWLDGLKDANESRRMHEELLKLEPGNYDARLIPGTHEYMIGTLPLAVRLLVRTAGLSGNRDKGLRMVEEAAQHGQRARTDAEILLPVLYRRENRSREGIAEMRKLADEYPRNFLFRIELVKFYTDAGETSQADAELRRVDELIDQKAPGYCGDRVPLIRMKEAEAAMVSPSKVVSKGSAVRAFAGTH